MDLGKKDFALGKARVFPASLEIQVDGKMERLEPRVMALLCYLAGNPGKVLSKEDIIGAVWGGTNVVDEALQRGVSILRKKLGEGLIETIPKRGYRLLEAPAPLGEEDMNLTEKKYKMSVANLIAFAAAGAVLFALVWFLFAKGPETPKADGMGEHTPTEEAPPAPQSDDGETKG